MKLSIVISSFFMFNYIYGSQDQSLPAAQHRVEEPRTGTGFCTPPSKILEKNDPDYDLLVSYMTEQAFIQNREEEKIYKKR